MKAPNHIKCMQCFLFEGRPSADECTALLWDMEAVCGVQGAGCGHQLLLTPPFASSTLTDVTECQRLCRESCSLVGYQ